MSVGERCDGHGGDVKVLREVWQLSESVTIIREVGKVLRNVCQLMERCDGHVGGIKGCGEV